MDKKISIPWTKKEKDFVFKKVLKENMHPYDVWPEYNEKFKRSRSYNAIKAVLKDHNISYVGLIRKDVSMETAEIHTREYTEEDMRQILSKKGYKVEKIEAKKIDRKVKIDTSLFDGDKIKLAVISCTQLGSKFQQLTHLKTFYQYIQEEGVKAVLHLGDMVDGIDVYRGHEYELFLHGAKAQKDYCIEHYPRMENGGKTFVITGNHDHSFMKKAGEEILEGIAKEREDIEYLGMYGAYPQIGGLNIYMQHGGSGVSYARSYRLQKNVEQFSPDAKPDIYFLGHYHVSCALFEYRNVTSFMIPCFQSQTPFLRRKALYPEIGGLIIEFTVNNKPVAKGRKYSLAQMQFRFLPFYVPINEDY